MNIYTISQVAKTFNITTNKIRFYEEKGLLQPLRDIENKYRRFNDEDILRLQSILLYRSIGLSIEKIKDILSNNINGNHLNHFNDQWRIVNNEIHRLNNIRKSLENILDKVYETSDYKIDEYSLGVIKKFNELYRIKNNWTDKWNFNNWARTYDEDVIKDKGKLKIYRNYNYILDTVYNLAINSNINNPYILEIGIGTGNLANKFFNNNYDIVGIDQSREMVTVAKEKNPKLKVRLGEFLKIPFFDKCFDIIVSTYAFHHLNKNEKVIAIEEMNRVLKDNGKIIIGDLMFKDKNDKSKILESLSKDEIEEVQDEYYSNIDFLETEFKKVNKVLKYTQVDKFNYIILIS